MEDDISHYFSNGLQVLGLELSVKYLRYARMSIPNLTYISVGTGNGYFEKTIEEIMSIKIICIDPNPNTFNPIPKELVKSLDFSSVEKLMENSNILNCVLILNWADVGESDYDYEAILLLKPTYILWIGEINGCAGGNKFHSWLKDCESNNYKIVMQNMKGLYIDFDLIYSITLLELSDNFVKSNAKNKQNYLSNIDKIYNYLSNGVQAVGMDNIAGCVENIPELYEHDWISIGSGNGVVEKYLDDMFNINIICVDPLPETYLPAPEKLGKKPIFHDINDLVNSNPKLIESCNLLLNWTYPDLSYDIEAINILKPKWIIWIGEKQGAAGGDEFHMLWKKWDKYYNFGSNYGENCKDSYKIIKQIVKTIYFAEHGFLNYTVAVLKRNDIFL